MKIIRRWDREEKFTSNPNIFALGKLGNPVITLINSSDTAKKYYIFARNENKEVFHVNVPENQPSPSNFSFKKQIPLDSR